MSQDKVLKEGVCLFFKSPQMSLFYEGLISLHNGCTSGCTHLDVHIHRSVAKWVVSNSGHGSQGALGEGRVFCS